MTGRAATPLRARVHYPPRPALAWSNAHTAAVMIGNLVVRAVTKQLA